MKNFFSELSRKVFKDYPTGDELADSLNREIFNIKTRTIKNKMYEYKNMIDSVVVDIPEFCKPKAEQFETFVDNQIKKMVEEHTLDYFYQKSLEIHS